MTKNTETKGRNRKIYYKCNLVDAVVCTLYVLFTVLVILGMVLQSLVVFIVGTSLFAVLSLCISLPTLVVSVSHYKKFKKMTKDIDCEEEKYAEYTFKLKLGILLSSAHLFLACCLPAIIVRIFINDWINYYTIIVVIAWTLLMLAFFFCNKIFAYCGKQSLIYAFLQQTNKTHKDSTATDIEQTPNSHNNKE